MHVTQPILAWPGLIQQLAATAGAGSARGAGLYCVVPLPNLMGPCHDVMTLCCLAGQQPVGRPHPRGARAADHPSGVLGEGTGRGQHSNVSHGYCTAEQRAWSLRSIAMHFMVTAGRFRAAPFLHALLSAGLQYCLCRALGPDFTHGRDAGLYCCAFWPHRAACLL